MSSRMPSWAAESSISLLQAHLFEVDHEWKKKIDKALQSLPYFHLTFRSPIIAKHPEYHAQLRSSHGPPYVLQHLLSLSQAADLGRGMGDVGEWINSAGDLFRLVKPILLKVVGEHGGL